MEDIENVGETVVVSRERDRFLGAHGGVYVPQDLSHLALLLSAEFLQLAQLLQQTDLFGHLKHRYRLVFTQNLEDGRLQTEVIGLHERFLVVCEVEHVGQLGESTVGQVVQEVLVHCSEGRVLGVFATPHLG